VFKFLKKKRGNKMLLTQEQISKLTKEEKESLIQMLNEKEETPEEKAKREAEELANQEAEKKAKEKEENAKAEAQKVAEEKAKLAAEEEAKKKELQKQIDEEVKKEQAKFDLKQKELNDQLTKAKEEIEELKRTSPTLVPKPKISEDALKEANDRDNYAAKYRNAYK